MTRLQQIANICGLDLEYMGRCVEAQKVISKNDVARFIKIAEDKAKKA